MGGFHVVVEVTTRDIVRLLQRSRVNDDVVKEVHEKLNRLMSASMNEVNMRKLAPVVPAEDIAASIVMDVVDDVCNAKIPSIQTAELERMNSELFHDWSLERRMNRALLSELAKHSGAVDRLKTAHEFLMKSYFKEARLLRQQMMDQQQRHDKALSTLGLTQQQLTRKAAQQQRTTSTRSRRQSNSPANRSPSLFHGGSGDQGPAEMGSPIGDGLAPPTQFSGRRISGAIEIPVFQSINQGSLSHNIGDPLEHQPVASPTGPSPSELPTQLEPGATTSGTHSPLPNLAGTTTLQGTVPNAMALHMSQQGSFYGSMTLNAGGVPDRHAGNAVFDYEAYCLMVDENLAEWPKKYAAKQQELDDLIDQHSAEAIKTFRTHQEQLAEKDHKIEQRDEYIRKLTGHAADLFPTIMRIVSEKKGDLRVHLDEIRLALLEFGNELTRLLSVLQEHLNAVSGRLEVFVKFVEACTRQTKARLNRVLQGHRVSALSGTPLWHFFLLQGEDDPDADAKLFWQQSGTTKKILTGFKEIMLKLEEVSKVKAPSAYDTRRRRSTSEDYESGEGDSVTRDEDEDDEYETESDGDGAGSSRAPSTKPPSRTRQRRLGPFTDDNAKTPDWVKKRPNGADKSSRPGTQGSTKSSGVLTGTATQDAKASAQWRKDKGGPRGKFTSPRYRKGSPGTVPDAKDEFRGVVNDAMAASLRSSKKGTEAAAASSPTGGSATDAGRKASNMPPGGKPSASASTDLKPAEVQALKKLNESKTRTVKDSIRRIMKRVTLRARRKAYYERLPIAAKNAITILQQMDQELDTESAALERLRHRAAHYMQNIKNVEEGKSMVPYKPLRGDGARGSIAPGGSIGGSAMPGSLASVQRHSVAGPAADRLAMSGMMNLPPGQSAEMMGNSVMAAPLDVSMLTSFIASQPEAVAAMIGAVATPNATSTPLGGSSAQLQNPSMSTATPAGMTTTAVPSPLIGAGNPPDLVPGAAPPLTGFPPILQPGGGAKKASTSSDAPGSFAEGAPHPPGSAGATAAAGNLSALAPTQPSASRSRQLSGAGTPRHSSNVGINSGNGASMPVGRSEGDSVLLTPHQQQQVQQMIMSTVQQQQQQQQQAAGQPGAGGIVSPNAAGGAAAGGPQMGSSANLRGAGVVIGGGGPLARTMSGRIVTLSPDQSGLAAGGAASGQIVWPSLSAGASPRGNSTAGTFGVPLPPIASVTGPMTPSGKGTKQQDGTLISPTSQDFSPLSQSSPRGADRTPIPGGGTRPLSPRVPTTADGAMRVMPIFNTGTERFDGDDVDADLLRIRSAEPEQEMYVPRVAASGSRGVAERSRELLLNRAEVDSPRRSQRPAADADHEGEREDPP